MKPVPTLFEYVGGLPRLEELTSVFYDKVKTDDVLSPVFEHMSPDHPKLVAAFLAESMGGGVHYSKGMTSNEAMHQMVSHHLQKYLTEEQRRRWVLLLLDSADEIGFPDDPEFRSAFVAKIEWGTRIAVINSQFEENPVVPEDHIPVWGWGEVRGPYESVGSMCQFEVED
jgi:hemoglobin